MKKNTSEKTKINNKTRLIYFKIIDYDKRDFPYQDIFNHNQ